MIERKVTIAFSDDYMLAVMATLEKQHITKEQFAEHYLRHTLEETQAHFGIPQHGIYAALQWWDLRMKHPNRRSVKREPTGRRARQRRTTFTSIAARAARAAGEPIPLAPYEGTRPALAAQRARARRPGVLLAPVRLLVRVVRRLAWEVAGFFHPEIPLGEAAAMRTRAERDNREATR